MKTKEIITDRLILREIKPEDSEFIVALRSDPKVYKYFKNPIKIDIEAHNKWFNESYVKNENRIDMVASDKSNGNRIGVFGINRITGSLEESILAEAEVSYINAPEMIGHGYASEAIKGIVREFGTLWKIDKFVAQIHKDNSKSIHFIEKLGFKLDKTDGDMLEYALYKDGCK